MMKKSVMYLVGSLVFFLFTGFLLFRYSEKPSFYVSGVLEAKSQANELSSYPYLFFSIHKEQESTPFATAKLKLHHDFTRGGYHFTLNDSNLFRLPMTAGEPFPDRFILRVRMSRLPQISIGKDKEDNEEPRQVLGPFSQGETNLKIEL